SICCSFSTLFLPLFFFFYRYRDHRYLHSFPTRRSSIYYTAGLAGLVWLFPGLAQAELAGEQRGLIRWFVPITLATGIVLGLCGLDRKSTRLNSSHVEISYAVFCLKKKKIRNSMV